MPRSSTVLCHFPIMWMSDLSWTFKAGVPGLKLPKTFRVQEKLLQKPRARF